jgi:Tol biopolymer transport system component
MDGKWFMAFGSIMVLLTAGCFEPADDAAYPDIDRESKLPSDIVKRTPSGDHHPPILHSGLFEEPVPVPYPVSTSGAEDSPFVLPDGNTLYFFFTPDVRIPVEKQLLDDVTGVYVTHRTNGTWSVPERQWLQEPGKLSLDGAVCVQGDEIWFASAREGYTGVNMFTAHWDGTGWTDYEYSGDRLMKDMKCGEVHIRGDDLYFHSDRAGGEGGYDIWMTSRGGGVWSDPVNLYQINSPDMDGWPFISSDGMEMWFTRTYLGTPAIYRSVDADGGWTAPELMFSQFAGEPTLDEQGNLYFVHHYYENNVMIEADIYVAYRK